MSQTDELVRRAAGLRIAGDCRSAVRTLIDAGDSLAVRIERGRALRGMGKASQAMAQFEAVLLQTPGSALARTEIAVTLRRSGRIAEALAMLDALAKDAPASARVHVERCRALHSLHDRAAVLAAAEAGLAAAGPVPALVLQASRCLNALHRPAEALGILALAPAEDHADWRRQQARALRSQGDHAGALAAFQAVAAIEPANAVPHCDIGVELRALGQVEAAVEAFLSALRMDPHLARAAAEAGVLLRIAGRPAEAEQLLQQFVRANPAAHPAWVEWVRTMIERGRHRPARAALKAYAPRPGREARDHALLRALLAKRTWRFDAAGAAMQEALDHEPHHAGCHHEAARLAVLDFDLATSRRHLARHLDLTSLSAGGPGVRNLSQSHVGRFINEFALEPGAVEALRRLARKSPKAQLEPLRAFVLGHPHHSGAAMLFLRALRRSGRFDATPGGDGVIPATLGQFWDYNIPEQIALRARGWADRHPGLSHTLYDNQSASDAIEAAHGKHARRVFRCANGGARKADLFRLALTHAHGGWWADADDLCLGPATGLAGGARLVLWQEEYGSIGNNFFAAAPGHPVIGAALAEALDNLNRGDSDSVWFSTGPALWSRALAGWLAEDLSRADTIRVLQRHELQAIAAFHVPAAYKTGAGHWAVAEFGGSGQKAA